MWSGIPGPWHLLPVKHERRVRSALAVWLHCPSRARTSSLLIQSLAGQRLTTASDPAECQIEREFVASAAKLFAIAREFPTDSGPIDVLATDQGEYPYIIETKLYKNPDKRFVPAQVLDCGAALWANPPSPELLAEALRQDAAKRGQPDRGERLLAFLDPDSRAAENHLIGLPDALADGRFTAIVLMDRLTQRPPPCVGKSETASGSYGFKPVSRHRRPWPTKQRRVSTTLPRNLPSE